MCFKFLDPEVYSKDNATRKNQKHCEVVWKEGAQPPGRVVCPGPREATRGHVGYCGMGQSPATGRNRELEMATLGETNGQKGLKRIKT